MTQVLSQLLIWFNREWSDTSFSYRKQEELQQQRSGVVWLAIYYFFQLFTYRILVEMDNVFFKSHNNLARTRYDGKIELIVCTLVSALVVGLLLWLFRNGRPALRQFIGNNTIRAVLLLSSFCGIVGTALLYWYVLDGGAHMGYFQWGKGLFAASWAPAIGLAVVWVCEKVFIPLRMSAILFIGMWGFMGAGIASLMGNHAQYLLDQKTALHLLSAPSMGIMAIVASIVMFLIPAFNKTLSDSRLTAQPQPSGHTDAPMAMKQQLNLLYAEARKHRKLIVFSCILGLSVQYFTFFVGVYEKLSNKQIAVRDAKTGDAVILSQGSSLIDSSKSNIGKVKDSPGTWTTCSFYKQNTDPEKIVTIDKPRPSFMSALRYIGLVMGCISVQWILNNPKSRNYRNTKRLITQLIFIKMVIISLFFLIFTEKLGSEEWVFHPVFFWTFGLAIGYLCVVWLLGITHVAENFNLVLRPWVVILAPNVYRFSELILQLRAEFDFYNVPEYSSDISIAVLAWGCIFLFISLLGSLILENNYGNDALYLPTNENIDNTELRKHIKQAKEDSTNPEEYYKKVNEHLHERFKTVLKEHFYMSAIYHKSNAGEVQPDTNFKQNSDAYRVYMGQKPPSYISAYAAHLSLIGNKATQDHFESWGKRILDEEGIKGGLLWLSGKSGRALDKTYWPEAYEVIDLSQIHITDIELKEKAHTYLDQGKTEALTNLFSHLPEKEWFKQDGIRLLEPVPNDQQRTRLMRTLSFFKIDAERYDPERFYLYVIKPHTSDPKIYLAINTVVPLSEKHLQQLRALAGFAESEWDKKTLQTRATNQAYKEIMEHQSHTQKHTFGSLLRATERIMVMVKSGLDKSPILWESTQQIKSMVEYLARVNRFNLAVIRTRDGDGYKPLAQCDGETQKNLKKQPFSLDDLLQEIYEEMADSIEMFRFSAEGHQDLVENLLREKAQNPASLGIKITAIETGMRIVLTDLLKNAIKRTYYKAPALEVSVTPATQMGIEGIRLLIKNNQPLKASDYLEFTKPMHDSKLGIRTIRELLEFPYLVGQHHDDPKITLGIYPPETDATHTTTYLFIPNLYVTYEKN